MRQIGTLNNERHALRLASYLLTLGIHTQVETEPEGVAVWAYEEDRMAQARDEFERFVQNPDDPRYDAAEQEAVRLQQEFAAQENQRRKNLIPVRRRWTTANTRSLTFVLIAVCCAVGFATDFGARVDSPVWQALIIDSNIQVGDVLLVKKPFSRLWDVYRGQLWRLVTPILLHGSAMHLLMNMMALHSLGKLMESLFGVWKLAWLVLVIAVVSNLSQYAWTGPNFAGMSGVIFGLFGYIWMKSRFDPQAGFVLNPSSVTMMLGWMLLCLTGWVGPIANAAHVMGLVAGVVLGVAPLVFQRLMRR